MGQTFVYNLGDREAPPANELHIEYGLFFDGTRNNRENTQIRKKVEQKGEFKDAEATENEKKILDKYAQESKDDSFANDFTNVARKWFYCSEGFRIYISGIATVRDFNEEREYDIDENREDDGPGYKYGRGENGIIEKVQNGCDEIANKIRIQTKGKKKIDKIYLTLDVFGFSRGAAAARNFAYNVQMRAYKPEKKWLKFRDHNGNKVKTEFVKDKKLPAFGALGVALLEKGVSRTIINKITLKVRFLGIYDTVASYDPKCLLIPNFRKYINNLHLNNLGNTEKAVHFTAMDEHRKNFSLTRLKTSTVIPIVKKTNANSINSLGLNTLEYSPPLEFKIKKLENRIEKNLPGVHSDVGGSYNNDALSENEIKEIVKNNKINSPDPRENISEYEIIHLDTFYFKSDAEALRQELINQGWYKEEQLEIKRYYLPVGKAPQDYYRLIGKRYLYRGYSLIPLHFMAEYAEPLVNRNLKNLFYDQLLQNYTLNDAFLEEVKTYLKKHTIENDQNWNLIKQPIDDDNANNLPDVDIASDNCNDEQLEGVNITIYRSDIMLKKLRNKYSHRSAKVNTILDRLAHGPNTNRIRDEF